jgi:hypothetical protein
MYYHGWQAAQDPWPPAGHCRDPMRCHGTEPTRRTIVRKLIPAILLASALIPPARAADIIFDSGGFEGYALGAVAGQDGWHNDDFDPLQPNTFASIAAAPLDHGQALSFQNTGATESSATVEFGNLVGTYNYAVVSFDMLREGGGANNTLWWSATGSSSTGYYGLAEGGAAPGVLPVGFFAPGPSVPVEPSQWMNVRLEYDLVNGLAAARVDGTLIASGVNVGTSPAFSGWNFTDQGFGASGGERVFVDNLTVSAANGSAIPEPSTLALMALAAPFGALRRRKT